MNNLKPYHGRTSGYTIGNGRIVVHENEDYPGYWFLSIDEVDIHSKLLCSKSCTTKEIARYINALIRHKLDKLESLHNLIIPLI